MDLIQFTQQYPPQSPKLCAANNDELRLLTENDGVNIVSNPPAETSLYNVPDESGCTGCHLWVITVENIPYILERASIADSLTSGIIKHTNLTGGGMASCGGELWVDPSNHSVLYINGCSGRYGPKTPQQLQDAEKVFITLGYEVRSFGWDVEVDKPARVIR